MSTLQKIGSYFDFRAQLFNDNDTTYTKVGKAAAGVGVAGLALVSWKFVAAGALAYSAYKGGQFVYGRFFQRHEVKKDPKAGARVDDLREHHPEYPVNAGHDAHNDQQKNREQQVQTKSKEEIIQDLRAKQAEFGKTRAIRNAFELVISHPKVEEKGQDLFWLKKMLTKHGKWARRTAGLSLYAVKAYRKMECCFPKKRESF